MVWIPEDGNSLMIQYTNVTDGQMDRQTRHDSSAQAYIARLSDWPRVVFPADKAAFVPW